MQIQDQPSCLQCKQAFRDCVSRSRMSVAALSVCPMLFADDCWWCIVCLLQLQGGRHCDVCCMCQIWALTLDPSSFSNAARLAGLGRRRGCVPAGYFSSLVSASSASFFVTLITVPPLESRIFFSKKATWSYTEPRCSGSPSLCLSCCVSANPQAYLVVLSANIHHCLVSD